VEIRKNIHVTFNVLTEPWSSGAQKVCQTWFKAKISYVDCGDEIDFITAEVSIFEHKTLNENYDDPCVGAASLSLLLAELQR
jgi:hypothetical protein